MIFYSFSCLLIFTVFSPLNFSAVKFTFSQVFEHFRPLGRMLEAVSATLLTLASILGHSNFNQVQR